MIWKGSKYPQHKQTNSIIYRILERGKSKEQDKRGPVLRVENSQQMVWYIEIRVKYTIMNATPSGCRK